MSCGDKNKLVREGTSHLNRVIAALSPGYAKVDERDTADLLLFAKKYAAYLDYHDSSGGDEEGWERLMKIDISVTLATLMKIDVQRISTYKKLLYKNIKIAADDTEAGKKFKFLFDLIFSLIRLIDEQYSLIPAESEFKQIFKNCIAAKMQQAFLQVDKLFAEFKAEGWIDTAQAGLDGETPIAVVSCSAFDKNNLANKTEWGVPPTSPVNTGITLPGLPSIKDNIICIINHNLFNAQVDQLFKALTEITNYAGKLLQQTLDEFPSHTPHYALFLTFIKLFRQAQDHLNNYTQRHLDFYYKDTLQLKNKKPEPDSAHLVFELQKPVPKHLLKKDALFKGGKDSTGKEISYVLTDDIVINKASVSAIHSWQLIDKGQKLLASPVAASSDGQGAEIKEADKSWFTFGNPKKASPAKTGFAIVSNILFLKEGTRKINVTVIFPEKIKRFNENASFNCFSAMLTGEKGWHTIPVVTAIGSESNKKLKFEITLSADDPPIIPYTEKIHKENFKSGLPVLKIYLEQEAPDAIPYRFLCGKKINAVHIRVEVDNVKDLVLSNDKGSIDASKPFKPFGDFADDNDSFYIGSNELFQKNLQSIRFNLSWKPVVNYNENLITPRLLKDAFYLGRSGWKASERKHGNVIRFEGDLFKEDQSPVSFERTEPLKATTKRGFVRLVLNDDRFSQIAFNAVVNNRLNHSKITFDGNEYGFDMKESPIPIEAILNDFSLDYSASEEISFNGEASPDNHLFYHITHFGYSQENKRFANDETNLEGTAKSSLLPDIINNSELFIGFDQAAPDLVVNILFQVADGSSNPLRNIEQVNWFYLAKNNNWKKFEKQFVIDRTNNFIQSGIVTITLPADISNDVTLLQKGLYWIKAAVRKYGDAVCKMISIQAQAAKVTLRQDEQRQIEFRELRASGSVSRLTVSDAAIKTIGQPFDSSGGRMRETDEHFYVRVSERLRHKQRAITIWDYEHIILEKFPEIFKVKCLNHSGFYNNNDENTFCENYSGHVTIITIPDLKNKTNINPLKPYTSIRLLEEVNAYLKTITSPFVKLHVKNPAFEEIRLQFEVKFYDNLDEAFYLQLLNMEIEKFLCPWAYDGPAEISFGGKIRKSSILNFVEERPYVDYVTCFNMDKVILRQGQTHLKEEKDIEVAEGSTSRSVLVSYYNEDSVDSVERHLIKSPADCDCK